MSPNKTEEAVMKNYKAGVPKPQFLLGTGLAARGELKRNLLESS